MLANIVNVYALIALYFMVAILLHCLSNYYWSWGNIFSRFMIIGSIVGILLLYELTFCESWIFFVSGTLIYAFICELYIFLFTLVSASISVAILLQASNGKIALDSIKNIYGGKAMLEKRLSRLQHIHLIQCIHNSFNITAKGEKLLKYFLKLQKVFNHVS